MPWGVQLFYTPKQGEPVHTAGPCDDANDTAKHRAESFVITNDPEAAREHFPKLIHVDITALWQLVFPASASENFSQIILECGSEERASALGFSEACESDLHAVWDRIATHLDTHPLWALVAVEQTLREAEDDALAAFFGLAANRVRKTGKNCGDFSKSFEERAPRSEKKAVPAHADCSAINPSELVHIVGPQGAFAGVIPNYEPRPAQAQMASAVAEAFNGAKHLAVEAGTGVGKSIAYLLPAAKWALLNDTPVVIATHMKNLQSQLIEKDIPMLRRALELNREPNAENLRVALIKGRANYLCLRKLGSLLEGGSFMFDRAGLRQLARSVMWAAQTPDGDLDTLSGGAGADASFLRELASPAEECAGYKCRHQRRCMLRKARDRASQAHLALANHALFFVDHNTEISIPSSRQVIFDEAHNLEETATRHFSVEISPTRLFQLVARLSRERGPAATGILESFHRQLEKGVADGDKAVQKVMAKKLRETRASLTGLRQSGDAFFNALGSLLKLGADGRRFRSTAAPDPAAIPLPPTATLADRVASLLSLPQEITRGAAFLEWPRNEREPVVTAAFELVEKLFHSAALLSELAKIMRGDTGENGDDEEGGQEQPRPVMKEEADDLESASAQLKNFAFDIHFALDAADANYIHWIQRNRIRENLGEILCAPLEVGPRLAEEIYAKNDSVIFCSATLRTGGNFNFIARRLGLDLIPPGRLLTCLVESPFDYTRQCRVFTTKFLPEPAGEGNTADAYATALAAMMRGVFLATGGRGLGLFTSYEMLQAVARLLRAPLEEAGIRVLTQDKGYSRDQITRIFRAGGGCVLLGTHSFWEGVDVVGEALSCVVIARLPFASPGDPITSARAERVAALGGNAFKDYSVPTAVIRFRQGFGRLIRSRSDRGVVIIADPRVETKFYGIWFRQSLPCASLPVESGEKLLDDIRGFLAEG